ncbi:hypothetical protein LINPERHAP2_LOCUS31936 [Linum perenne]
MKGVGGPLLNIGDLLADLSEKDDNQQPSSSPSSSSSSPTDSPMLRPPSTDLLKLFQEKYEQLNEALEGSDPNWTALTLKLCSSLETANKLVQSTNSNAGSLRERVAELEKLVKRGDSAVAAAKTIPISLGLKGKLLQCSSSPGTH